jgi:hypothetical protein
MEYTKPELVLNGRAESLVLGSMQPPPGDPGGTTTSAGACLEFED